MFCNMGVGEDRDGKTQTNLGKGCKLLQLVFLRFLAMEAFRCRKVFHWIFSAALPNACHAFNVFNTKLLL